jgi:hypothetical protein
MRIKDYKKSIEINEKLEKWIMIQCGGYCVLSFKDEAQTALFKDQFVPRSEHFSSRL